MCAAKVSIVKVTVGYRSTMPVMVATARANCANALALSVQAESKPITVQLTIEPFLVAIAGPVCTVCFPSRRLQQSPPSFIAPESQAQLMWISIL